jgi:hypothetical protein
MGSTPQATSDNKRQNINIIFFIKNLSAVFLKTIIQNLFKKSTPLPMGWL